MLVIIDGWLRLTGNTAKRIEAGKRGARRHCSILHSTVLRDEASIVGNPYLTGLGKSGPWSTSGPNSAAR